MPDITMCKGIKDNKVCPLKEKCYRYLVEPSKFRQSYFVDIPYDFENNKCEHFWNIDDINKLDKLLVIRKNIEDDIENLDKFNVDYEEIKKYFKKKYVQKEIFEERNELFKSIQKLSNEFKNFKEKVLKNGEKVFKSLNYEDRLYLVAYITNILYEHANKGGTYRYLIYERFGFDLDSYVILQMCGMLEIHNLISGELK